MIDRDHSLSVVRQCQLLALSRSSVYYRPMATPPEELALMRLVDELHLQFPWMGSRSLRDQINRAGIPISRDRVRRVMGKLGIHAIYRKPRTTIPDQGHTIYPYLLRNRVINGPAQVWCADVTYIPMALGFMYLVAVMDWYSRKVLAWRLSNTPTKAASSPVTRSPICSRPQALRSAWMARAAFWTTCASSGYGARSNMRKST